MVRELGKSDQILFSLGPNLKKKRKFGMSSKLLEMQGFLLMHNNTIPQDPILFFEVIYLLEIGIIDVAAINREEVRSDWSTTFGFSVPYDKR